MDKLIKKVNSTYLKYDKACSDLENKLREVCDFNARLTWCKGDGHLVLNEETASVARMACLNGRTENDKLTEEEHYSFSI